MTWKEWVGGRALRWLCIPMVALPLTVAAASASPELKNTQAWSPATLMEAPLRAPGAPKPLDVGQWQPRLSGSGVSQATANNSPETAQFLSLDTQWSDTLDVQDEEDWYYTYVPNGGKVTAFLSTVNDASVDFDLYLYKYDPVDGSLTPQTQSLFGPTHYEQASTTATAGDCYFFMVHAYQGASPVNPYTLVLVQSSAPDVAEPDDNPWQARGVSAGLNATQTLDNALDEDWAVIQVPRQNNYKFSLNTAAAANYRLQLFSNPNGAPAATVNKNASATYTLPAGTWYLRVLSLDTVEPATPYTVRAGVSAASLALSRIDTDSGAGGYYNRGYGYAWEVYHFATFVGSLKDIHGAPVPNAPVDIVISTPETVVKETRFSGAADANGNFTFRVDIPAARGTRYYQQYNFKYYFDLASYNIKSGAVNASANLYHYAHVRYSPP
jgi:hypothetical protein